MIWLIDLWRHWNERRKFDKALKARKAIRKIEGERVRQGKLAAQRKFHLNDPLWGKHL